MENAQPQIPRNALAANERGSERLGMTEKIIDGDVRTILCC